jgi:predicted RND superfamily exporter protein
MITSLKRNAIPRTRGFRLTRELLRNELKRNGKGLQAKPLTKAQKEEIRSKISEQIQQERKANIKAFAVTIMVLVLLLFLGRWLFQLLFQI